MAALVGLTLAVGACTDDSGGPLVDDRDRPPNPGALPTIPGGVELPSVDPASVLVGDDLSYGTPLPSQQVAAEAFKEQPEVASVVTRRVYRSAEARPVGTVLVLQLDGHEIFDEAALAAYEATLPEVLADGKGEAIELGATTVQKATGPSLTAAGHRHGNQLVVVRGPAEAEVLDVVQRQIAAIAAGATGTLDPATPLAANGLETVFVEVPTVSFAPIPPPEEEPIRPEPPSLPGALWIEGRYGVMAGERRTVAWVIVVDPAAYPTAEALDAALPGLVSARADGRVAQPGEVLDRVVLSATGEVGERSARVFRHGGIVVLVEGERPDQLDSVVTDWIAGLSTQRL